MTAFKTLPLGAMFTRSGPAVYRKQSEYSAVLVHANGDHRALQRSGTDADALVYPIASGGQNDG